MQRQFTSFRATEVADVLCASLGLHSDRLGATTRLASIAAAATAGAFSVCLSTLIDGSGGTVLQRAPLLWAGNGRDDRPLCRSLIQRIIGTLDIRASKVREQREERGSRAGKHEKTKNGGGTILR